MKVTLISGSRNQQGQTARAVDAFKRGILSGGAEVEKVVLPAVTIERCRQCEDNGWGICREQAKCIIEDDFASIVDIIKASGAVVFVTPVYSGDMAESMRAFLDRLRRICFHQKRPIKGMPAVAFCVAGGSGRNAVSCCTGLEKYIVMCGFDLVDIIPVRRQNLDFKKPILEATGKWLSTMQTPVDVSESN